MPRLSQNETLDSRFYTNAYVHAVQCLDRLQASSDEQFWFKTGNVLVDDADKLKKICESHQYPEDFIKYLDSNHTEGTTGVALERDALLLVNAGWVNVKHLCNVINCECGDQLDYVQANVSDVSFNHGKWHIIGENNDCLLYTSPSPRD